MVETVLLVGKIAFLLLLYLFIFSVVRSSARDLRLAAPVKGAKQWSMPGATGDPDDDQDRSPVSDSGSEVWTLAVVKSPCIPVGAAYALPVDAHALAGRSSDMDILLDDTFVSSKHARFEVTEEGFAVEDLRSTNGTMVNGVTINKPTFLEEGDRVSVGDTVFEVKVR